jgi:tetratricopeptide (TPR) repeat protein
MRIALSLALLVLVAMPAQAARKSANTLVHEAERLYQQGRYHDAAERLKEAEALSPNPRLVYNIARAYDQAGELDLALQYYQEYVNSPEGTDPTLLKRSSLAIDRLHGLISEKKASEAEQEKLKVQADEAKRAQEAQAEAARHAREEQQAQARSVAEAQQHTTARAKTYSYIAGGVGLAGLAAGIGFGLSARSAKSNFSNANTVEEKQSFQNTAKNRALYADIGFGVAIASAVTAYLLWPKGSSSVAVVPAAGPNGGGLALEGSF